MQETNPTMIKVVYLFTTFCISIYDSSAKEVKDNIADVTFRRDWKKGMFTSTGWEFVKY